MGLRRCRQYLLMEDKCCVKEERIAGGAESRGLGL